MKFWPFTGRAAAESVETYDEGFTVGYRAGLHEGRLLQRCEDDKAIEALAWDVKVLERLVMDLLAEQERR